MAIGRVIQTGNHRKNIEKDLIESAFAQVRERKMLYILIHDRFFLLQNLRTSRPCE
jgi:hypothetical protein